MEVDGLSTDDYQQGLDWPEMRTVPVIAKMTYSFLIQVIPNQELVRISCQRLNSAAVCCVSLTSTSSPSSTTRAGPGDVPFTTIRLLRTPSGDFCSRHTSMVKCLVAAWTLEDSKRGKSNDRMRKKTSRGRYVGGKDSGNWTSKELEVFSTTLRIVVSHEILLFEDQETRAVSRPNSTLALRFGVLLLVGGTEHNL